MSLKEDSPDALTCLMEQPQQHFPGKCLGSQTKLYAVSSGSFCWGIGGQLGSDPVFGRSGKKPADLGSLPMDLKIYWRKSAVLELGLSGSDTWTNTQGLHCRAIRPLSAVFTDVDALKLHDCRKKPWTKSGAVLSQLFFFG